TKSQPVTGQTRLRTSPPAGRAAGFEVRDIDGDAAGDRGAIATAGTCTCTACAGGAGHAGPAKCPTVQRQSRADAATPSTMPAAVDEVLGSPGQPLDGSVRADMETRFGHDFGQVRVHTDAHAAASARAIDALAYTAGRDIVFASGQHAPHSAPGR